MLDAILVLKYLSKKNPILKHFFRKIDDFLIVRNSSTVYIVEILN